LITVNWESSKIGSQQKLEVSKNWKSAKIGSQQKFWLKKRQLPALKSGNAGSWILSRINGFYQQNCQGFFAPGISREPTPQE
jgi:hypothetical protein